MNTQSVYKHNNFDICEIQSELNKFDSLDEQIRYLNWILKEIEQRLSGMEFEF